MKLDIDCVRDVLLELESFPIGCYNASSFKKSITEHGEQNVLYTLAKLTEAQYVNATLRRTIGGQPYIDNVFDLTFTGHEFLNSIRTPEVWKRLKGASVEGSTACLKVVSDIAVEMLKEYAKQKLGIN